MHVCAPVVHSNENTIPLDVGCIWVVSFSLNILSSSGCFCSNCIPRFKLLKQDQFVIFSQTTWVVTEYKYHIRITEWKKV